MIQPDAPALRLKPQKTVRNQTRMTRGHDSDQRGWRSEWIALAFLVLKGYWPHAMRYRTHSRGGGEIDIIVQRGNLIAAVDVRSRPHLMLGHETMNDAEWHRRRVAMDDFMRRNIRRKNFSIRFDLVIVTPYFQIQHVEAAWQPEF